MNRVKIVTIIVMDYDEAIRFYTEKIGFSVQQDASFGDGRWVTLSLPGDESITIALERANTSEDRAIVGKQSGSFPMIALDASDCLSEYSRMKALGVKFHGEPEAGPWGTGVLFEDLYGNRIFISQEP